MEAPLSRPVPPSKLRNSRSRKSSHGSEGSHPSRPTSRHSNPPPPVSSAPPSSPPPVPFPVPDSHPGHSSPNVSKAVLKRRLRELLAAKDEEVKSTGRLGERLVSQRVTLSEQAEELERSIDAYKSRASLAGRKRGLTTFPDSEDDDSFVGDELVEQVATLETDLKRQRKDNDNVYRLANGQSDDDFRTDTRATASHRMSGIDPVLATGISDSLLARIRGLQGDILKRDNTINSQATELEEKSSALRHVETTLQGLKEENWNLEVMCQELRTNVNETTTKLQKTEGERNHSTKELGKSKETLELTKTEVITLKGELDKLRNTHETTLAALRKQNAGLQRDRSDLQSALESTRTELDSEKRKPRGLARRDLSASNGHDVGDDTDSPFLPAEEEDDALRTPRRKTGDGISTPMSGDALDLDSSFSSEEALDASTKSNVAASQDAAHLRRTIAHLRQALIRERESRKHGDRDGPTTLPGEPVSPITRALGARGRGRGARKGQFRAAPSRLAQSAYLQSSELSEEEFDEDTTSERSMQGLDDELDSLGDHDRLADSGEFNENDALNLSFASNVSRTPSVSTIYNRQMVDAAIMTDPSPKAQHNEQAIQTVSETKARTSDAAIETDTPIVPATTDAAVGVDTITHAKVSGVSVDAATGTTAEDEDTLDISTTPVKKRSTTNIAIGTEDSTVDSRAGPDHDGGLRGRLAGLRGHGRNFSMASEFQDDEFTDAERGTEDGYFTDALESAGPPTTSSAASSRARTPTSPNTPQTAFLRTIGTQAVAEDLGDLPVAGALGQMPSPLTVSRAAGVQTQSEEKAAPLEERPPVKSSVTVSTQTDDSLLPARLRSLPAGFYLSDNNRRSVGTFGAENLSPNRSSFDFDNNMPLPSPVSSTMPGTEKGAELQKAVHKKSALENLGIRPDSQLSAFTTTSASTRDAPPVQQRSISDQGPQTNTAKPSESPRKVRPIPPPPAELLSRARGLSARSVPSSKTPFFLEQNSPALPGVVVSSASQGKLNSTQYDESMPPPSSTQPRYVQSAASLRTAKNRHMAASAGPGLSSKDAQDSRGARDRRYSNGGASVSSLASSQSSEVGTPLPEGSHGLLGLSNGAHGMSARTPLDPLSVQAITQAMVGADFYKYTRKKVGRGLSEKRHKRFFWIHPYSRTLHWGTKMPTSTMTPSSSARTAEIYRVREVEDNNPYPRGLPSKSIVLQCKHRIVRMTAETEEMHNSWIKAIDYLLKKNYEEDPQFVLPDGRPLTPTYINSLHRVESSETLMRRTVNRLRPQRSTLSNPSSPERRISIWQSSVLPNAGSRDGSIRAAYAGSVHSSGMVTPAPDFHGTTNEFGSPDGKSRFYANSELTRSGSISSSENIPLDEDGDDTDGGFEGLENVRACCDGRHSLHELSASARKHHLKYHVNRQDPPPNRPHFRPRKGSRSTTASSRLRQDVF